MINPFILRSIFLFGIITAPPHSPVPPLDKQSYNEIIWITNVLNLEITEDSHLDIENWEIEYIIEVSRERHEVLKECPTLVEIPKINRANLLAHQELWRNHLKWLTARRPVALHKLELYNEEIAKATLVLEALDYLDNAATERCTTYFRRLNFKKYAEICGKEVSRTLTDYSSPLN